MMQHRQNRHSDNRAPLGSNVPKTDAVMNIDAVYGK
jgi:hypothetical protein